MPSRKINQTMMMQINASSLLANQAGKKKDLLKDF